MWGEIQKKKSAIFGITATTQIAGCWLQALPEPELMTVCKLQVRTTLLHSLQFIQSTSIFSHSLRPKIKKSENDVTNYVTVCLEMVTLKVQI